MTASSERGRRETDTRAPPPVRLAAVLRMLADRSLTLDHGERSGRLRLLPPGQLRPAEVELLRPWADCLHLLAATRPLTPAAAARLATVLGEGDGAAEESFCQLVNAFGGAVLREVEPPPPRRRLAAAGGEGRD